MTDAVRSGQLAAARVLQARWRVAQNTNDQEHTEQSNGEMNRRLDALLEYIDAHDLQDTEVDPRR
jgi:hypothetical protein